MEEVMEFLKKAGTYYLATDDNGQPIAALDYENGLMPITSLFDHEVRTPAAVEQKVRRLVAQAS